MDGKHTLAKKLTENNYEVYDNSPNIASGSKLPQEQLNKLNAQFEQNQELAKGFNIAEMYLSKNYLDVFQYVPLNSLDPKIRDSEITLFKIDKIVFDPNEEINDRLISVYNTIYNFEGNIAIIISGTEKEVDFYLALGNKPGSGSTVQLLSNSLSAALKGNFPGITLNKLGEEPKQDVLSRIFTARNRQKNISSVSIVPSMRDDNKENFVQGIEKFIDGMLGSEYIAVILASSVNKETLKQRKHGFEAIYSYLSPYGSANVSYSHSDSESVGKSISRSFSDTINESVSNTNGKSESFSSGNAVNYSSGSSSNSGFSQSGASSGSSFSNGTTKGSTNSYISATNFSNSVTNGTGHSLTDSEGNNINNTTSDTATKSMTFDNKGVQSLMQQADLQLERLRDAESMGLWECGCYFLSDDIATAARAASLYKALMSGSNSYVENTNINIWDYNSKEKSAIVAEHIRYLHHPSTNITLYDKYSQEKITPTNLISGKELPIFLGFPRRSVPGLPVIRTAEFGRAVVYEHPERVKRVIEFGDIYHMGNVEKLGVPMDLDLLSSHCFITGSSGSGKSFATYQLLDQVVKSGVGMLVIEPAKGEYKQIFGNMPGISIYNADQYLYKMLKINPFKFPENISLPAHIEKLMQIFGATWELNAAMPAILKEAVIRAYLNCGWDVETSTWLPFISEKKYPVFKDIMEFLPKIIDESEYSSEAKGDYKGALLTRVESMTTGIAGFIFDDSEGIPDEKLFDGNVVVDLSEIGADETIALIMGILIMRLGEYRLSVRKMRTDGKTHDADLQHITVLEEAHNLLKRTNKTAGGNDMVTRSVQMISNSIKEMRTYGEGFIIIDQSPMAVDTSAIENTSTKIIMNTPAKDACEELGSALSLNAEQVMELSRMDQGVCAVFQKGWLSPVLMKVKKVFDTAVYNAKLQTIDMSELKRVRGELIGILIRQYEKNSVDFDSIRNIVLSDCPLLNEDQKSKFTDILAFYELKLKTVGELSSEDIGQAILDLSCCKGLFRVLFDLYPVDKFNTAYNKINEDKKAERNYYYPNLYKNATAWYEAFIKGIDHYAAIRRNKRKVLKYILITLSKNNTDSQSPYTTIYRMLKMQDEAKG